MTRKALAELTPLLVLALASALCLAATGLSHGAASRSTPDSLAGRYVVSLAAETGPADLLAPELATRYGGEVLYVYRSALSGFAVRMSPSAALALGADPRVARVTADVSVLPGVESRNTRPAQRSTAGARHASATGIYVVDPAAADPDGPATAGAIEVVRVLEPAQALSAVLASLDWVAGHGVRSAIVVLHAGEEVLSREPDLGSAVDRLSRAPFRLPVVVVRGDHEVCAGAASTAPVAGLRAGTAFSSFGPCIDLFAPGHELPAKAVDAIASGLAVRGSADSAAQVVDALVRTLAADLPGRTSVSAASSTGNDAAYVSQVVPFGTIPLCTDTTVSVTMKNTGTTTWSSAGGYKLGSDFTRDNTWWGTNRVALPNSVNPGETVTFTFAVHPTKNGTFNFAWQMVQDPIEWFGLHSQVVAEYDPPSIDTFTLSPTSISRSQTSTGTVVMDGPAPSGCGVVVTLSSSNPSIASVPTSITIPSGSSVGTFTVTPHSTGVVTITGQSSVIKTASLSVH